MRMTWDLSNGLTTTVVLPRSSVLVEVGVRISNNWLSAPLGSGLAVADVCSRKAGGGQKAGAATRSPSDSPPGYDAPTHPTSEMKQPFDIFYFDGWMYARICEV